MKLRTVYTLVLATLVVTHLHEDDGYYEFEFSPDAENNTGEAEVRVDGSSGDAFRVEEEIEPIGEDEQENEDEDDEDGDGSASVGEKAQFLGFAVRVVDAALGFEPAGLVERNESLAGEQREVEPRQRRMGDHGGHQFLAESLAAALGVDDDVEDHRVVGVVGEDSGGRDEVSVVFAERDHFVGGRERLPDRPFVAVGPPLVGPVERTQFVRRTLRCTSPFLLIRQCESGVPVAVGPLLLPTATLVGVCRRECPPKSSGPA